MSSAQRYALLLAIGLAVLPDTAPAQAGADNEFVVIDTAEPPRGARSSDYLELTRRKAIKSNIDYVTELEGNLMSGRASAREIDVKREFDPITFNGFGALLAFLVIVGLLLMWLKFGGSGTLLARDPRADRVVESAPQAWKIRSEDMNLDPRSLLARIAGMKDRTEAMVYLLRHSLLAAARATEIRFARSDTERSAMARLPKSWRHHGVLRGLLQETELAHYGGRPVSEEDFKRAMQAGETILLRGGHG